MGAARIFRAAISGAGTADARVRYYIDGSECEQDHYISHYVKDHGKMPPIPVGKGGRASDEEIAANAPKPKVDQTSHIDKATTSDELRTDGPTLEEYVAAGYDAANYPPQGYAVNTVPHVDELEEGDDEEPPAV